ncbi:MAG: hypothetical protein ACRDWH_04330 [Acidimicrobiia bacterium]
MVGPGSPDDGAGSGSPEHALISLRLLRHPEWHEALQTLGVEPLPAEVAVQTLASQQLDPMESLRVVHDLGVLGRLDESMEAAEKLAAGSIKPERFGEMIELANQPDLTFTQFVDYLKDQGIASTTLMAVTVAVEACTDDPIGPGPNQPTRIVASIEAPGNPGDFAYGADPLHWPECNSFFISMSSLNPKTSLPAIDNVNGNAYMTTVQEVVGLPMLWEITTDLDVRYFVSQKAVGMDFAFAGGDGQIDVDHGYVIVEPHPNKSNWVVIRSQKTVRFVGIPNFPATLACELGWVHLMQNMASCQSPN